MKVLLLCIFLLHSALSQNETDICSICKCNYSNTSRNNSVFIECFEMEINELPEELRIPTPVDTLDLSKNSLNSASVTPRSYRIVQVRELRLEFNVIETIYESNFDHLRGLEVLNMSSNYLQFIIGRPFHSLRQLQYLDLSKNLLREIPENLFRYLMDLRELNLAENPLHLLPANAFFRMSSMTRLDLSSTALSDLARDAFKGCSNLQFLDLSWCNFEQIPTKAFEHAEQLEHLKLSGNPIKTLEQKSFWFPENLLELELSQMPLLLEVRAQAFSRLKALVKLDLRLSKMLSQLDGKAFDGLQALRKLDLSDNDLNTVKNGELLGAICSDSEVNFTGNPWHCDCELKWMLKCEWNTSTSSQSCLTPSKMQGFQIMKLTAEEMSCEDDLWIAGLGRIEKKVAVLLISLGAVGIMASICGIVLMIKFKPRITLNRRSKGKNSDLYYLRLEENQHSEKQDKY